MDKRQLSLLFLAHASDVLENAFAPLNDDDYDLGNQMKYDLFVPGGGWINFKNLGFDFNNPYFSISAMRHVRFLLDSDLETESTKQGANELMWAVFTAFIK